MKHASRFAPLPLALALAALWGHAHADTILPDVMVEATRPDTSSTLPSITAARAELARSAGGTGVVDVEQESRGRQATISDTLGYATGVFVQPRFGSDEARLSVRGSGLQRTFHMRGIKLLQDGVPLNLADGGVDFQALEPLATRYVEVFRGANALRYGSTTLGGAINYVSPSGRDAGVAPFNLRSEAGSFGYLRNQIAGAGKAGDFDGYVSLSQYRQDGFRDHARQDSQRLFGNLGWQITPQLENRLFVVDAHSNSELPGSLSKAQLQDKPHQANAGSVSGHQKRDIDLTRVSNRSVLTLGEQQLELNAFYARKVLFHPIYQVLDQNSDDYGVDGRFTNRSPLFGHANRLTVGVAQSWGRIDDQRFANNAGSRGAMTESFQQDAQNLDVYAENQFTLSPGWQLNTGVQWSEARREQEDRFKHVNTFEQRYHGLSPKLGLLHETASGVQWFANWSRSFEPPSFSEMSGAAVNAGLKAQTANTVEIGTRGQLDAAWQPEWDISLYDSRLRNELISETVNFGNGTATFNAPKTRHRGIELGLALNPTSTLNWRSNLLYNRFSFEDHPEFGNNRQAGLPQTFIKTELTQQLGSGYYLAANAEVSPQRYAVDHANTLYADGYAIWGLKAGRQLRKGLGWFVEGRNLSNKRYAATTSVIKDAGGADSAQFMPGDGRSFYTGLEWKL